MTPRAPRASRAYRAVIAGSMLAVLASACSGPTEKVALPPTDAGPDVVVATYLEAVKAGDCDTAGALWASGRGFDDGDLCGHISLESYDLSANPAEPNADERIFSMNLIVSGGGIVMEDGLHTWFYSIHRQADDTWRLIGGGTGP